MKSGYVRSAGRKVLTFALVLAVSVGILGGCVPSSKRPKNLKSVSYRLKWLPNANYIDGYVAQSKGYFAEQGLSCTVRPGGPDLDSIKSVASGSDDFGVTGADQLIMARSHGIDIVAIAAFFQGSPVC